MSTCPVCGHARRLHRLLHSTLPGAILCRKQKGNGAGPCLCAYYDMRARVAP